MSFSHRFPNRANSVPRPAFPAPPPRIPGPSAPKPPPPLIPFAPFTRRFAIQAEPLFRQFGEPLPIQ